MKVLVVGKGAREHALVWKLAQSPHIEQLYAAPGSPGIAEHAQCLGDIRTVADTAGKNKLNFTVHT